MTKWQDKGVGFLGKLRKSEKQTVRNEDDGTVAGYHVKHWDGRQDAVAQVKTVKLAGKVEEVGDGS